MNRKFKKTMACLLSALILIGGMMTAFAAEEGSSEAFAVDKAELEFLYSFCQDKASDENYFSQEFIAQYTAAMEQLKNAADNYEQVGQAQAEEAYWNMFETYNDACLYNSIAGDVDGDGKKSISDVTLMQKFTARIETMNCSQMYMLGAFSAEEIDISKSTNLQMALAGFNSFDISESYTELEANRDVRNIEINSIFLQAYSEREPEGPQPNGIKVFLSPSNQYANTYSAGNTNEMIQCNKIAQAVEVYLLEHGFDVKRAPQGQDMYDTIDESNEWGADLHVPIHTNAFNYKVTGGTMVMVYDLSNAENTKAARSIYDSLAPVTPGPDQGILVRKDLHELSDIEAMSVYVECEYHDTVEGATFIINNIDTIAQAIAKGICNYYNIEW